MPARLHVAAALAPILVVAALTHTETEGARGQLQVSAPLPSVRKPSVNPVIGPSWIPGSQDYCGARDMGVARAGNTLTLVYSGYSNCSMGSYDDCGSDGCCQLMFATMPVPVTAKATRLGTVLPPPGRGFYNVTTDAYLLYEEAESDGSSSSSSSGGSSSSSTSAPSVVGFTGLDAHGTDAGTDGGDATQASAVRRDGGAKPSSGASGRWHMWVTEMTTGVVPPNVRGGLRNIGHLVADGTGPGAVPTEGWSYANTAVFPPRNLTPWAPLAVDEPRVYPKTGGGWIMYVGAQGNNNLGTRGADAWCVGYATAPTLDGPWAPSDACVIGSGNASGYQAEGFVSFTHAGRFYLIVNRLGDDGARGKDWLKDVVGDLWASNSQTEGWELVQEGFVGRGAAGAWDAGFAYVTGLAGYELTPSEPLYGVYMGGPGELPGAGPISIGVFELSAASVPS